MRTTRAGIVLALVLTFAAQAWFAQRFAVRLQDEPDGRVYLALAQRLLADGVYSIEAAPDQTPTRVRLPGYPWILAGILALCGNANLAAVRVFQALLATLVCAGVGRLAFLWEPDPARKTRAAWIAFALAAVCPFTAIYTAVVQAEMLTLFLLVALLLAATGAWRARTNAQATLRWVVAGLLAGAMQLVRPESGLFAAAVGFTLVGGAVFGRSAPLSAAVRHGAVFSCAFALMLVPWTWRNARVFHRFAPLPPANMLLPGETDWRGFHAWYRTWADSEWSLEPYYWDMTDKVRASTDELPERAFDSAEERARTEELFERYNQPAGSGHTDHGDDADNADRKSEKVRGLTRELDDEFGRLAQERVARAPWRHLLILPLRRAWNLWFSPHATYYPFDGPLFPREETDFASRWWPVAFLAALLAYTVSALAGWWRLARLPPGERADARRWAWLALLIVVPRWAYLATMENTEPRYMVEIFPLVCVLGGIALAGWRANSARRSAALPSSPTIS